MSSVERSDLVLGLVEPLARTRARQRLRLVGIAITFGLALGLLAAVGQRVAAYLLDRPLDSGAPALLAGLVVFGGVMAIGLSRLPSPIALARRADRHFGFAERLSTAVEVAGRGDALSPVEAALIADAEAHGRRFDPAAMAPLLTRAVAFGVGALAVALVLFALVDPVRPQPEALAPAAAPEPAVEETAEEAGAALTEISRLLAEEASMTRNDYLETVAEAVQQLSAEAAAGRALPEVEEQLRGLLEHAELAFAKGNAPDWIVPNPQMPVPQALSPKALTSLAQRMASARKSIAALTDEEMEMFQSSPLATAETEPADDGAAPSNGAGGQNAMAGATADDILELYTNVDGESEAEGKTVVGTTGDPGKAAPSFVNLDPDGEGEEAVAATLAGAAEKSGKGASILAGFGTESLDADTAFLTSPSARGGDMVIEVEAERPGQRIRVEMSPQAKLTALDGTAIARDAGGGRLDETPTVRPVLTPAGTGAVDRYFGRGEDRAEP